MRKRDTQRNNSAPLPLLVDGIDWRNGDKDKGGDEFRSSGLLFTSGTITVLIGPNGAGKTTLLEKLAGLRPPERLKITYGSEPLWQEGRFGKLRLNVEALYSYSYACQSSEEGLFARTLHEELDYSLRPYKLSDLERESRSGIALSAVGWDSTWLTRDPYLMSGGERRRSALASVFVTPADWFLLDEPTAGLDGAGHERVAQQLVKLRDGGSGVLLVSHDSDWALPLADNALLLSADGTVRLCSRDQLLAHPEWLEETGMKIPDWLEIAHLLWRNGAHPEKIWNAEDAAAEMVKVWERQAIEAENSRIEGLQIGKETEGPTGKGKEEQVGKGKESHTRSRKSHRLTRFDPRAVWLAYVLLSTGLFLLTTWFGVIIGTAVVITLLTAGKVSLRRWQGLIINYIVFSLVTSGLFAVGAGSGSGFFDMESFIATLFSFIRTMLVLLLGLAIPLVMTPLSLRRSLEQMISIRGHTPQWAQRFILTVTLMMRFVPVLLTLWERFDRIFLARGKSISRKPSSLIRRLRDVSLPFLLALFRLGDEVALALESRGVGFHLNPTRAMRLKWGLRDYGMVGGALVLAMGLWVFTNS